MMYGRSEQPQQWSVHAEFTISHDGLNETTTQPQTHTQQDENGVRMVYSWTSQPMGNQWGSGSTTGSQCSGNTPTNPQQTTPTEPEKPLPGTYGFQRGNMLFTSTPPQRRPYTFPEPSTSAGTSQTSQNKLGVNVQDSGYGSDLLSPNSYASTLPRRPSQVYNRRCKSTCSIILQTAYNEPQLEEPQLVDHNCNRTQSLRCQTPTSHKDQRNKETYYGCGDPWCHHANYNEDFCTGRFSPVYENEEYTSATSTKRPSRASTYTPGIYTTDKTGKTPVFRPSPLKDACVQTFEMVDKCTSPFMKTESFHYDKDVKNKKKKRALYNARRKTEPLQRFTSPSVYSPDSLESRQSERHLMRSPAQLHRLSDFMQGDKKTSTLDSKSSGDKKPRTVHIDVYCTGTEMESSSSSDSENKSLSTPQTVFESERVVVKHKRSDNDLPQRLKEQVKLNEKRREDSKEESDIDDGASTAYPSQVSSYSHIRDFGSSLSSVPQSWSSYSMSSCAVPDCDYDSVANTSWKDTVSDFDSLMQSRSSVAPTESSLFIPRKYSQSQATQKSESIDEYPEYFEPTEIPSRASLHPSDSFEYANSEDRARIKEMEQMWGTNKQWKSPQFERKHQMQQRKLKEYLDKRLKELPKWESKETDSEDSDASETGWTFVKDDDKKLERDTTVRRASKDEATEQKPVFSIKKTKESSKENLYLVEGSNENLTGGSKESIIEVCKPVQSTIKGNLLGRRNKNIIEGIKDTLIEKSKQVASSSASKSPSSIALTQRLSLNPNLRAPFTILPGIYTDQRQIAKKFGPIIDVFKKPGHHIGPVRNPDCLCAHCESYFSKIGYRNRARSVGENPNSGSINWKDLKTNQSAKHIPEIPCTDF